MVTKTSGANFKAAKISDCGTVTCQSCLHRPENWLVRQLNDKSKPVYKVGFISEKGKATAREVQWILEASSSLLR
jgi:hypothetical protein